MKRTIILIFSVGIVGGLNYLWTSPEISTSKQPLTNGGPERFSRSRFHRSHPVPTDAESVEALQRNSLQLDNLWAAMQEGHEAEMSVALQQLAGYMETHPEAITEILTLLKTETDDGKISLLIPVLAQCHNSDGQKLVTATALEFLQSDWSDQRRIGLDLLAHASPVDDALLQTVTDLIRQDSDNQIRIAAIDTLGLWRTQSPNFQNLDVALLECLEIANDETVSGRVLQILAQQNVELPEATLKVAAQSLSATSADNRITAVMVLGQVTGEIKSFAMEQLQHAYPQETNLEVKKNILSQLVRMEPEEASKILQRLSENENTSLLTDIKDYLQIIADGKTATVNQIFSQKFSLEAERIKVGLP